VLDKVFSNKKQAIWAGKQCYLVQNEIFKRLWLCFIIHTSKMNASNIFLLSKTLELKLESFDQQIMKIKGHLIFLQREKLAPKSKIQPS
jgi:hypothetical protein